MKIAVALLVVLNLALAAWWQGHLAPLAPMPGASEREPMRLERQLQPQAVSVVAAPGDTRAGPGAATPAATTAPAAATPAGPASAPPATTSPR